ncbi:MAG: peptide chain release factor N(5)-glutamine methyltransferase [Prolixibacteraceae bacterium]|jgi:release factor glutamine methyltransferase
MENLYAKIKLELEDKLSFLEDKPEETIDSTLQALWHKASGFATSAENASKFPLTVLSNEQQILLNQLVEKRLNGTPLAHLTERQNFLGLELICDKRALIPRKETEILGKAAIDICKKMAIQKSVVNIFDVCCGSGNLGLAIAFHQSNTRIHSSDLSAEAVELTKENISLLKLEQIIKVTQSDLFSGFESEEYFGKIDLIVCNPPYISTSKVLKMNSEIAKNEPAMAFDGGMIGLKIIQKLIQEAPRFLTDNGWLIFEVGLGQGPFVIQLCEKSKQYNQINSISDSSGNIRVIAASIMKSGN